MDRIADVCIQAKRSGGFREANGEDVWQQFGLLSGFFIYPGTKWCGAGNISEGYDDLGPENETDACCREHDHCEDHIPAYKTKYGLKNGSPFTKSHCDCDTKFYRCLMEADTRTSHRVGKMYFNILRMDCFRRDHPIIRCKRFIGRVRRRCQEYELDREKEPIWQMFDAKHYEAQPDDEDNEIEDDKYRGDLFEYLQKTTDDNEQSTLFKK